MLNVSLWKGFIRFGKWGKLDLRYIVPFDILARFGPVDNQLQLPQELSSMHDVFHVSNLKKFRSEDILVILLDEIRVNTKLNFAKDLIEIMDQKTKDSNRVRRYNEEQVPSLVRKNPKNELKFQDKIPLRGENMTIEENTSLTAIRN